MFEIFAELSKEEENLIVWNTDIGDIKLSLNIHKWRIPNTPPKVISIKFYFQGELEKKKLGKEERIPKISRIRAGQEPDLKNEKIYVKMKKSKGIEENLMYYSVENSEDKEIESFYLPTLIFKDKIKENINIVIEWIYETTVSKKLFGDFDEITGDTSKIYGYLSNIRGDVSKISGDISNITGNVSNISGDISDLFGDVSNIRGSIYNFEGDVSDIKGDVTDVEGDATDIAGDVTEIEGDVSKIKGDVTNYKGQIDLIVIEQKFQAIKDKFNWKILEFNDLFKAEDLDYILLNLQNKSNDSVLKIFDIIKRIIKFIYEYEFKEKTDSSLNIWLKKLKRRRILTREIFLHINSLQFTGESVINDQKIFSSDEWKNIYDITVPIFIIVIKWFYDNILIKEEFKKLEEIKEDFELPESINEVKLEDVAFKTVYLKIFQVKGLFDIFNHSLDFNSDTTMRILFGANGTGKTTSLEMISNLSEGNIGEILKNKFKEVTFIFSTFSNSEDSDIEYFLKFVKNQEKNGEYTWKIIYQENDKELSFKFDKIDEDLIQILFNISALYQSPEEWLESRKIKLKTIKAFYPNFYKKILTNTFFLEKIYWIIKNFKVNYISSQRLKLSDKELNEFFIKFDELTRNPIIEIKALFNNILKDKAIYLKKNFQKIDSETKNIFVNIVNEHLYGKVIEVNSDYGFYIHKLKSSEEIPLYALSSGEKNIIILFFCILFETKENSLLLIDEPEISLNVKWKITLLENIFKIIKDKSIRTIISTHSPQIVGDHLQQLTEFRTEE